jgi:hypothetical protein
VESERLGIHAVDSTSGSAEPAARKKKNLKKTPRETFENSSEKEH